MASKLRGASFLLNYDHLQFLGNTNYLASRQQTALKAVSASRVSITTWDFKLISCLKKYPHTHTLLPFANPKVPEADDCRHYLQQFLRLTGWDQNNSKFPQKHACWSII